ncbi:MAG: hypothetical protein ACLUGY_21405 [Phocaeicola massiliensis]
MLNFVLCGLKSLEPAYQISPLAYKENLHKEDNEKLSDFLEAVDNCTGILKNLRDTRLTPMNGTDMRNLISDIQICLPIPVPLLTYISTMSCMQENECQILRM